MRELDKEESSDTQHEDKEDWEREDGHEQHGPGTAEDDIVEEEGGGVPAPKERLYDGELDGTNQAVHQADPAVEPSKEERVTVSGWAFGEVEEGEDVTREPDDGAQR